MSSTAGLPGQGQGGMYMGMNGDNYTSGGDTSVGILQDETWRVSAQQKKKERLKLLTDYEYDFTIRFGYWQMCL